VSGPRPSTIRGITAVVLVGAPILLARALSEVVGEHPRPEASAVAALSPETRAGAEFSVVSFTKGGAGQVRDAGAATRAILTTVRERELEAAGKELVLTRTRCLDHPDGGLSALDDGLLLEQAKELGSEFDPDVVITFGPEGFSGHPDHVAVGEIIQGVGSWRRWARHERLATAIVADMAFVLAERLDRRTQDAVSLLRAAGTRLPVSGLERFGSRAAE
jgi:LmbE family N-acetylglucosaminyl deacetylase